MNEFVAFYYIVPSVWKQEDIPIIFSERLEIFRTDWYNK